MKALISIQFEKFHRAMVVIDHEVGTDLAELARSVRKLPGVRNAAMIASHLQWVALMPDGRCTTAQDVAEALKHAEVQDKGQSN